MIETRIKQPGETLKLPLAFATGVALAELVDATCVSRGLVPGSQLVAHSAVLVAGAVAVEVMGGTDGERYLVTVRVRDASDQVLESEIEVAVIEAGWQLPDGGAPYLSIIEFVERFGLEEVVRMTDSDGSGRIDRAMLVRALGDAQAQADAYISAVYRVPLSQIPSIVAMTIADLARARLYPRGAPDGIDAASKAAIRFLERVESGKSRLGIPEAPTAAPSSNPVMFVPGRRAYPNGLDDF